MKPPIDKLERAFEAIAFLAKAGQPGSGKSVLGTHFVPVTVDRDGERAVYEFKNGYSASVISSGMAYGGLELAVMVDDELCYDTPVTDDVEGNLDQTKLDDLLAQVNALPRRGKR